ncbi:MAG: hypothetical protein Q9181_006623 [Wetmoreana brouardii]
MPPSSFSFQNLTIAWAAQVSLAQLGARLTAYMDTRATITAFRFIAQHAPLAVFRNLPEEMLSMIATVVRDQEFQRNMKRWVQVDNCLANTCTTLSHVPVEELNDFYDFCTNNLSEGRLALDFEDLVPERHVDTIFEWSHDLECLDGATEIAKCVRAFTREFGIRPYFMLNRSYEDSYFPFEIDDKAYLILPLVQAPISSSYGEETTSFAVDSTVDFSLITPLTVIQRQKFQTAVAVLNHHAYDAKEDESIYSDKPRSCGCRNLSECKDPEPLEDYDSFDEDVDKNKPGRGEKDASDDSGTTTEALPASSRSPSQTIEPVNKDFERKELEPANKNFERKELEPKSMILGCGELPGIQYEWGAVDLCYRIWRKI